MIQAVTDATFISLGTAEKQPHHLDVHVTTIVFDFTSLQLTFLRLRLMPNEPSSNYTVKKLCMSE